MDGALARRALDPDRWLDEVDRGGAYVPFGWAPTACIGAQLGMCRLAMLRYRVDRSCPDESRGVIKRR
jgi:cytochrome P450